VSKLNLNRIISGIKQRDHKILTNIYKQFFPLVLGYTIRNGGDEDDAKDLFQDSLIVIYDQLDKDQLVIKEDFGSYLVGISRRMWLKQIRRAGIHKRYISQSDNEMFVNHPSEIDSEKEMEMALIRKHIIKLGKECQDVLLMSAEGIKNEEIAKKLKYKGEKTVRTKKYKCKEALIKLIKADPDYDELNK